MIQVHTLDSVYQCHTSPEAARLSCPRSEDIREDRAREVMLYKTRGYYGARDSFAKVLCPMYGQWRVTYTDTGAPASSCASPASRASNCRAGYKLELAFRGCGFPDQSVQWKCLGGWVGEDGRQYVSLLDTKLVQIDERPRPRYRCGIYKSDPRSGVTWLALSNDSTCHNQLWSHDRGHTTLQLHSLQPPALARGPRDHRKCGTGSGYSLPAWAQGDWGEVRVEAGRIVYRDAEAMVQYQLTAVAGNRGRVLVRVEAGQCGGRAGYACLALERRNNNVMELRMGAVSVTGREGVCEAERFRGRAWVTLTRRGQGEDRDKEGDGCPLRGQYSGTLPDGEGLCAR